MKNIIYLSLLLYFFSCENADNSKKPANFIEKEVMINLLLDMKIAQKARTVKNIEKKKNQNYMSTVFDKYQIDSVQFQKNNDYYTEHLDLYHELYTEVQKRLKDSLQKYELIKKQKDSLKKESFKKKSKPKVSKEIIATIKNKTSK